LLGDRNFLADAPHAALEKIAHAEVAADLLGVDLPALVKAAPRETTKLPSRCYRSVVRSSVMPSAK
jgi:hypothetical protein